MKDSHGKTFKPANLPIYIWMMATFFKLRKQKFKFGIKRRRKKKREKIYKKLTKIAAFKCTVFFLLVNKMQLIFLGLELQFMHFILSSAYFALRCMHFCCVVLICSRFFKSCTCLLYNRNFYKRARSNAIRTGRLHRQTHRVQCL